MPHFMYATLLLYIETSTKPNICSAWGTARILRCILHTTEPA